MIRDIKNAMPAGGTIKKIGENIYSYDHPSHEALLFLEHPGGWTCKLNTEVVNFRAIGPTPKEAFSMLIEKMRFTEEQIAGFRESLVTMREASSMAVNTSKYRFYLRCWPELECGHWWNGSGCDFDGMTFDSINDAEAYAKETWPEGYWIDPPDREYMLLMGGHLQNVVFVDALVSSDQWNEGRDPDRSCRFRELIEEARAADERMPL